MPRVEIQDLPDDARAWVFAAERELAGEESQKLLAAVDAHLAQWAAHGTPLFSGRDLVERRFLIVAVDQRSAGASGCSIDGLFRSLRRLEDEIGARLTVGGQVFARDSRGRVQGMSRDEFTEASARGEISASTPVFDTALTTMGALRRSFEVEAGQSWHGSLLAAQAQGGEVATGM